VEEVILKLLFFDLTLLFFENSYLLPIGKIQKYDAHQSGYCSENASDVIAEYSERFW
jgi:hypothetical protein